MSTATSRLKASRRRGAKPARIQKTSKISRWGNSLGVRIPQEAVEHLQLKEGESVSVEVAAGAITIRRARQRRKWTEAELLKGITPEMLPGESWPVRVGRETL